MPARHPAVVRDILALTAVALTANLIGLGSKSLWLDEATSVGYAMLGPRIVLSDLVQRDPNMALYYLLLSLWVKLFGSGEVAVRLPSALCAALTAPVTYLIGRRLFDRRSGVLAGLLTGAGAFVVSYGQTARGYTLLVLLLCLATLFLVMDIERPSRLTKAGYVLAAVLAFHVHFFAALVVAAHAIALVVITRTKALSAGYLGAGLAVAVLCAPILLLASRDSAVGLLWLRRPGVTALVRMFADWAGGDLVLLALLCAGSVVALSQARSAGRVDAVVLLTTWLVIPVSAAFLLSQARPLFHPRYLIGSLPALMLLAAAGQAGLRSRTVAGLATMSALLLSAAGVASWYRRQGGENWRDAVAFIRESAQPGEGVVLVPFYLSSAFDYYAERPGGPDLENLFEKPVSERDRVWLISGTAHAAFRREEAQGARSALTTHRLERFASYRGVEIEFYVRR